MLLTTGFLLSNIHAVCTVLFHLGVYSELHGQQVVRASVSEEQESRLARGAAKAAVDTPLDEFIVVVAHDSEPATTIAADSSVVNCQGAAVEWGCTCQGLSNTFGVTHPFRSTFGGAPRAAQEFWISHSCKTVPELTPPPRRPGDDAYSSFQINVTGGHVGVCHVIANTVKLWPPPIVVLRGSCNGRTVGNLLSALFMARIAAAAGGMRVRIARPDCVNHNNVHDADIWQTDNLFQILGVQSTTFVPSLPAHVTASSICTSPCLTTSGRSYPHECADSRLEYAAEMARHDLGVVAQEWLAGKKRAAAVGASDSQSQEDMQVGRPVELDDVAIHVRVGDILKPRINETYGIAPWWLLEKVFTNMTREPRTIGVITAANLHMARREDEGAGDLSMAVCASFVSTLV